MIIDDTGPKRFLHGSMLRRCGDVAGLVMLVVALHELSWPTNAHGLSVLIALAVCTRFYPMTTQQNEPALSASTPLLAMLAVYGPAWTVVTAAAAALVHAAITERRSTRLGRATLGSTLSAGAAALAFTLAGGTPGVLSLAPMLPALYLAGSILILTSNALTWSMVAGMAKTILPGGSMIILPALASEPALAMILAEAAAHPSPAALLIATIPPLALIIALRIHAHMRNRLAQAYLALQAAHVRLHVQATTDDLTGLANRRFFEETLRVRLAEAARYGRPLSVLVLDLDNFKHVNDRYGHAGGDAVLVAIAQTLKDGVRASDLPARLGGDEFVAVLPETTGTQALALARRIGSTISSLRVPVADHCVQMSASIGVASTEQAGAGDAAALLAAADGAAYAAKAAGKNNVRLATPTSCHDTAIVPIRAVR